MIMKTRKFKTGLTLLEMLLVLAIITLLAAMVVGIAARIDNQGKEHLTKGTLALLNGALGQFRDYGYTYKGSFANAGLHFPLDCNGLRLDDAAAFQHTLIDALGASSVTVNPIDPNSSGIQILYFFLTRVLESRKTLDQIEESLIANDGIIDMDGRPYPLMRIIDPWGTALHYSYYRNDNNNEPQPSTEPEVTDPRAFPVITSAGPDGLFGTDDDITNR